MAANGSLIEAEEFSSFNAGQAFAGYFFPRADRNIRGRHN
jgi:hypothetical protein